MYEIGIDFGTAKTTIVILTVEGGNNHHYMTEAEFEQIRALPYEGDRNREIERFLKRSGTSEVGKNLLIKRWLEGLVNK